MSRLDPLDLTRIDGMEHVAAFYQEKFGFVPNGLAIMARRPAIVEAFLGLRRAIADPTGLVSAEFKELIGNIASKAAGCRYCQAHTAFGAVRVGVAEQRLAQLWDYETSELFSPAERAALDLALAAASVPNAVDDELFGRVRDHWDDGQIVEIMSVVALYGFLNRWNDSFATELEEASLTVAGSALGDQGWEPGKHATS